MRSIGSTGISSGFAALLLMASFNHRKAESLDADLQTARLLPLAYRHIANLR